MRMVIILNSLMLGSIDTVGFKDKGITDVFFVAEHCVDGSFAPFIFAGGRLDALSFKFSYAPIRLMDKFNTINRNILFLCGLSCIIDSI